MIPFKEWLTEFLQDKEEVATFPDSDTYAVHTIHRYLDRKANCLWETGFTYTGHLVVRSGKIAYDGVKVSWTEWETKPDIDVTGCTR